MPVGHFFFGFTGRINRGKFWRAIRVYFVVLLGTALVLDAVDRDAVIAWVNYDFQDLSLVTLILFIVQIVVFVSQLSNMVKRLHDRDKSGWWVLAFIVPPGVLVAVGLSSTDPYDYTVGASLIFVLAAFGTAIWALIELGCLRGTAGPNRFGSDPLELQGPSYPEGPLR